VEESAGAWDLGIRCVVLFPKGGPIASKARTVLSVSTKAAEFPRRIAGSKLGDHGDGGHDEFWPRPLLHLARP